MGIGRSPLGFADQLPVGLGHRLERGVVLVIETELLFHNSFRLRGELQRYEKNRVTCKFFRCGTARRSAPRPERGVPPKRLSTHRSGPKRAQKSAGPAAGAARNGHKKNVRPAAGTVRNGHKKNVRPAAGTVRNEHKKAPRPPREATPGPGGAHTCREEPFAQSVRKTAGGFQPSIRGRTSPGRCSRA